MKKILSMLVMLAMLLTMCTGAAADLESEQIVTQGGTLYFDGSGNAVTGISSFPSGDAMVELKKNVYTTGTENEFEVELSVRTTQDIRTIRSDTPDAAVLLIMDVSNSMDYCATCGRTNHNNGNYGGMGRHTFVSRLTEAKNKAIQFLDDFVDSTEVQSGDKRYVAIVDFGSMAARRLDWVDVTDATQLARAKQVINGLTTAHSGTQWSSSDDGGTNIEAALMLGANVWNHANVTDIDYKYTILLSDGNPTYHASDNQSSTTDREKIYGTRGGGSSTKLADAKDVGKQADRILGLGSLSKLYSICFGSGVAQSKPFETWTQADPQTTRNMTVLEWMEAFSTKAYEAADADGLFDTFNSIISQIQLAAQAWKVEDVMGGYAVFGGEVDQDHYNKFTYENGTLNWDVLGSNVASVTTNAAGTGAVLEYALKYKVTLDNLNESYTANTAADTNAGAELTYAVLDETSGLWNVVDPVDFPKPQVQGYDADLSFTKVYLDGTTEKTVAGMEFKLEAVDSAATGETWGPVTAKTNDEGVVTFSGIPSGHSYILKEIDPASQGFAAPGDIPVTVSWETAASGKIVGGKLMNEKIDKEVTLTLSKAFAGAQKPTSVSLVISNASGYTRHVTLNEGNDWSMTVSGLEPGLYTITESAALDGYNMTASATLNGQAVSVEDGSVQVNLALEGQQSHAEYAVEFTNSYTRKVGGPIAVSKLFKESVGSGATLEALPSNVYQGVAVEIDFVNAQGSSEAIIELNAGNNWTQTLTTLPIGTYTIVETITGVVPDHDFIEMVLTADGKEVTDDQVTIQENTSIGIVMENHYLHHVGDIHVEKLFAGIDNSAIPSDKVYYIDVYEAVLSGDTYVQGNELITTIEVRQTIDGDWTGTSEDIEVGQYYLVERTTGDAVAIDKYSFVSGVFDNQVIDVTNSAAPTYVSLTNTYSQDMATLNIQKEFEGIDDLPADQRPTKINVNVIDRATNQIAGVVSLMGAWPNLQGSITLPLGEYYLDEVTSMGAEGTADIDGYGHSFEWTPSTQVTLDARGETLNYTVKNSYTKDHRQLTISKAFDFNDLTTGDMEKADALNYEIMFLIYKMNDDGSYSEEPVDSIVLDASDLHSGAWTKTVDLPIGTYRLLERGAQMTGTDYTISSVSVSINGAEATPLTPNEAGDLNTAGGIVVTLDSADSANPAAVTVYATNNYTRDTGSITVKKEFGANSELGKAYFENANKSIDVLIFSNGVRVGDPIALNKGNDWTATISGLPTGKYTLVEAHTKDAVDAQGNPLHSAYVEGYHLTYSWSGGAEVELTKGAEQTKTVTNTYSRQMGMLAISKRFLNVPEEDWPREITVDVMQGNEQVATITMDGAPWHEEIVLPVGEYTLVETPENIVSDESSYTHTGLTFKVNDGSDKTTITEAQRNSVNVTVTEGTTPSVRVYLTNTYEQDLGTITVTKEFAEDDVTQAVKENLGPIDVLVKRGGNVIEKLTLTQPTWTATTKALPIGTYTLEEVIDSDEANTAYVEHYTVTPSWNNDGIVTLTKNAQERAIVTNAYERNTASLTIEKRFGANSELTEAYFADKSIDVLLFRGGVQVRKVTLTGPALSATIDDLPTGEYTLVEVVDDGATDANGNLLNSAYVDGYNLTHSWTGGEGIELTKGEAQTKTVTNTYSKQVGVLRVSKTLENLPQTLWAQTGIAVAVKQGESVIATVELSGDPWYKDVTLPVGTYTLVETAKDVVGSEAEGSYTHTGTTFKVFDANNNGTETPNAAQIDVTVTEGTAAAAQVQLTNTYEQELGTITVTKEFAEDDVTQAVKENLGPIDVLVKRGGNVIEKLTLTQPTWTATTKALPIGTYTLEEVIDSDEANTAYVEHYTVTPSWNNDGIVTLTRNAQESAIVTNAYERNTGDLTVTKTVQSEYDFDLNNLYAFELEILAAANQQFTVTNGVQSQTITLDGQGKAFFALGNGQSLTVKNVPTGVAYTIRETVVDGMTTTINGQSAVIEDGKAVFAGNTAQTQNAGFVNKRGETNGELTISKAFDFNDLATGDMEKAGALNYEITFSMHKQMDDGSYGAEPVGSIMLNASDLKNGVWTKTVSLPIGTYRLVESGANLPGTDYALSGVSVSINGGAATVFDPNQAGDLSAAGGIIVEMGFADSGAAAAVTVHATNNYTRDTASLTIQKNFGENSELKADYFASKSIDVLLFKDGELARKVTLTGPALSATIDDLPTGKYTLVEVHADGATDANGNLLNSAYVDGYNMMYSWSGSEEIELTKGEAQTKTVTNTYSKQVGVLRVSKTLENLPQTLWAQTGIAVAVKQGESVIATVELSGDPWYKDVTLPVGTYTLVETAKDVVGSEAEGSYTHTGTTFKVTDADDNGTETSNAAQIDVTVTEGTTATAQVQLTNTYERNTGDLKVTKTVQSGYDFDLTRAYVFELEIPEAANQQFTVTNGVENQTITLDGQGKALFTLANGQSLTVKNVPMGLAYTVRETVVDGMTTTINGQSAVIEDGKAVFAGNTAQLQKIDFVNTRGATNGELTISKTLDSALRDDYAKEFTFTVQLDDASVAGSFKAASVIGGTQVEATVAFTDGTATVKLKHGEEVIIKGLPEGVGFTVTEATMPGFVVTVNGANAQSVKGVIGTNALAEFVNTSTAAKAELTVSKTVAGNASSTEDVFTFEVRIPELMDGVYGDMTFAGGTATVQLKHGQKAVAKGIPVGTAYAVTETDYGNYTPDVPGYEGTMLSGGAEAAFVNTLEIPELPETGDGSKMALWCFLLAIAGAGIVIMKRRDA